MTGRDTQDNCVFSSLPCSVRARHLHNATDGGSNKYFGQDDTFTSELAHKNLNTTQNWTNRIVKPNKWFKQHSEDRTLTLHLNLLQLANSRYSDESGSFAIFPWFLEQSANS